MRGYEGNLEGDRMGEGLPSVASQGGRAICGDATKGGTWNLEAKGAIGTRLGPQEGGVGLPGAGWDTLFGLSYLVDPASSHMLVSKIKPCMCKYKLILYCETANGSLNQL